MFVENIFGHKMKTKIIAVCCLLFLSFPTYVQAGDPGGPYVVWVNLSKNSEIDKMLDKRLQDDDDRIPSTASFLFRRRPNGMTNELVYKAVIKDDKVARKLLSKMIRQPFKEFDKGFDGIIIYDEEKVPRFSVMLRDSYDVYKEIIPSPKKPGAIWDAFCTMMPEVTRKP